MSLKIAAISDESIYPNSSLPRTLVDILKILANRGCTICLIQPGSSNFEYTDKLFHVITFSKTPSFFKILFNAIKIKNEPLYKTFASWLNLNLYRVLWNQARHSDILLVYDVQYSIHAVIISKIARKPVIMLGDLMYISYYRGTNSVSRLFLWFLLAWEKSALIGVNRISVWGSDDKNFLISAGIPDKKISTIPLSLDIKKIDSMALVPNHEQAYNRIKELKNKGLAILMFHGNLDYPPNRASVDYIVNELAPELQKMQQNIAIVIVGDSNKMMTSGNDRILFTGRVENLFSCIALADIGIVPLKFGAGVKNKILEYFALSKPVITTAIGVENLGITNMVNCLVTRIGNFPESISFLLKNPKIMVLLGSNGRKYLEEHHSLANYEKFLDIGKELKSND